MLRLITWELHPVVVMFITKDSIFRFIMDIGSLAEPQFEMTCLLKEDIRCACSRLSCMRHATVVEKANGNCFYCNKGLHQMTAVIRHQTLFLTN